MPTVTSIATVSHTTENRSLEKTIHRLKLQWMIAKSDDEKRKISEEIRRLLGSAAK